MRMRALRTKPRSATVLKPQSVFLQVGRGQRISHCRALSKFLAFASFEGLTVDDDSKQASSQAGLEFSPTTVDYSFYAYMKHHEVTEAFLWSRLLPHLHHLNAREKVTLRDALKLAIRAHDGQTRKSGEPFVTHPVEVTRILAEIGCELDMLVSGLLHDTVEDTDVVTLELIGEIFGPACQRIVEGETKFSKLAKIKKGTLKEEVQAMDLQQLFLAMTEDTRIIVVKLADRLHNMRTMGAMPQEKQIKIANETLQVFAPLAGLLGLWTIKLELEDLSLMYAKPLVHKLISKQRAKELSRQAEDLAEAQSFLVKHLGPNGALAACGLHVQVRPRLRSVYSLYLRACKCMRERVSYGLPELIMEDRIVELLKKHRALECLTDVVKFYLVVSPNTESPLAMPPALSSSSHQCYQVLGILHSLWTPVPGSIKDYISTPKQNGYQGLHSSLITFGCSAVRSVEIIVHTLAMHQRADFGIAAERWPRALHDCRSSGSPSACFGGSAGGSRGGVWDPLGIRRMLSSVGVVRGGTNSVDSADGADRSVGRNVPAHGCERLERDAIARRVNWLQSIRQWQREFLSTVTAREFMQVMRQDLLSRTIFAFTPAGDILRLPKGATVVDFAYHVHTEVGNTMVSAKVNNVTVDASYELQNADVVEILQYVCKNRRKQLERHRSWLPFARTQSARHKLQKFVHEQAALESCETVTGLTAPSTNGASQPSGEANSVATLDDLSQGWGAAEWPGARVSANKAGPPPSLAGRLGSNGAAAPAATEAGVGVELEVGSSDENAAVLTQQVESVWISLSCQNRTGILAEAAATIAAHGYNILSHNGGNHDLALQDNGYMNFLVDASRERLLGVREDLLRIPAVTSATFHTHNINNSDW